ncbi:HK97 gp10 family phage protein [Clostridium neuense]|uniref:HK97 gp10 family phage protein n=1 Tax=Clostridium neuense TaxID=1728934 RepID=A0ABW8T943_9CLOT
MIELNNIDELIEGLENSDEDFEEKFEDELSKLAYEFLEKLVERTSIRNGEEVRESWIIGPIVRDEEGWHIQVYNTSKLAKSMEYGYRTTDVSQNITLFVPGNHMMRISLEEFNNDLNSEVVTWLKNFWKGEFDGNL